MATIEKLFEKFRATYTEDWYNSQYLKFSNHPGKIKKAEMLSVLLEPDYEVQQTERRSDINFWDFIYDAPISSNYDDVQNKDKFVTIGETPEGYPIEKLEIGEVYTTMNCTPQLVQWESEFKRSYKQYLNKIPSILESGMFIDFLIKKIKNEISEWSFCKGNQYENDIKKFFDIIIQKLTSEAGEFQEIADVIYQKEFRIDWNGKKSELAKKLLEMEKFISPAGDQVLAEYFSPIFKWKGAALSKEQLRKAIQTERSK